MEPENKGAEILALPMPPNDAEAATIRDYLLALLRTLLREAEGFSGKRPFGNSGWEFDLYKPLLKAGLVTGTIDSYGYVERIDEKAAQQLIDLAIEAL